MSQTEELSGGQRVFATVAGIAVGIFASIWLLAGLLLTWLVSGPPVDWNAVGLSLGFTLIVPVGLLVAWLVAGQIERLGNSRANASVVEAPGIRDPVRRGDSDGRPGPGSTGWCS